MSDKEKFLKKVFGQGYYDGQRKNLTFSCPNKKCLSHQKNKKKFVILVSNWNLAHCWVCDTKGFYLTLKKYKPQFLQEYITEFCNARTFLDEDEKPAQKTLPDLPQSLLLALIKKNNPDPVKKKTVSYALSRGLGEADFWRYKILFCENDPIYKNRLIFPSFDENGKLNYFIGRAINKKTYPPYLQPDLSRNLVIFNEYLINFKKEIILVEGVFDMVTTGENSIPLLGSTLNENSLLFFKIIKNNSSVLLALDPDAEEKAEKIGEMLDFYGVSVRMIDYGDFNGDVGDMTKKQFQSRKARAKKWTKKEKLLKKIKAL